MLRTAITFVVVPIVLLLLMGLSGSFFGIGEVAFGALIAFVITALMHRRRRAGLLWGRAWQRARRP
jgi:hypothetical protein